MSVHLPNSLTGSVFGSSLSTNDNGVINMSGISSYLLNILQIILELGLYPSLYGDAIMPLTPTIQSYVRNPTVVEDIWNRRMSLACMCIELDYGLLYVF